MGDVAADPRRRVPRTDALLADPRLTAAAQTLGRDRVKAAVRRVDADDVELAKRKMSVGEFAERVG
ncbi:hypothetical protein AB0L34_32445, partial [Micromonospora sp. NPDC052213]